MQQITYMAPGDITVFHGFGCSVEFDVPPPEGTIITIKSKIKKVCYKKNNGIGIKGCTNG